MRALSALAGVLLAAAATPAQAASGAGADAPAYVDARQYPTPAAGWQRFLAFERLLVGGFDAVCGDTFCEGEYYNLRALRLRCSVQAASGALGSCRWTFAGSTAGVAARDGHIGVDVRGYDCALPLAPGTTLQQMLSTLEGKEPEQALHTALPGLPDGVYGALVDCL